MIAIQNVKDASFRAYGCVKTGYDFTELLDILEKTTDAPDHVIYVASDEMLEKTAAAGELREGCYGGMPIQIGYCNGKNTKLNCLEYHKGNEINIAAEDAILLLAKVQDAVDGTIDSSKVEAFRMEKGMAVELYATTFHYAPCSAKKEGHFRMIIVLPKGTNEPMKGSVCNNAEERRLFARNKWLIAHKDAPEAKEGAVVGILGENIDISEWI